MIVFTGDLPAYNHEFIDASRAARGRRETMVAVNDADAFLILVGFKRLVSQTPYLIHDTAKAPHITGSGVLPVVDGLKGRSAW